jgi:broad specificity phosphatase PhoE
MIDDDESHPHRKSLSICQSQHINIHEQAKVFVIVARHGERWDYVQREVGKGKEWIASVERPWDPPLSPNGLKQASRMGEHLFEKIQELGLPCISAVYSSPLLRCRQTACQAIDALNSKTESDYHLKVRVELGLTESLNQSWYRAWALIQLSDTTWGFVPPGPSRELHEYETHELHPSSQMPAEKILDWKNVMTVSLCDIDKVSNAKLLELHDMDYHSSTRIEKEFALKPTCLLETNKEQEDRMYQVLKEKVLSCIKEGVTRTLLMVSHGGPVTHLYSKLTGNNWHCHGESKYCCYSIYQFDSVESNGDMPSCKPLLVNESKYLDDLWSDSSTNI